MRSEGEEAEAGKSAHLRRVDDEVEARGVAAEPEEEDGSRGKDRSSPGKKSSTASSLQPASGRVVFSKVEARTFPVPFP